MSRSRWTEADVAGYLARRGQTVPALPGETPEGKLLAEIRRVATNAGWQVYHTYRSTKSEPGFPDLCAAKPGRLLFAELKSQRGKVTEEQHRWLDMLQHSVPGIEVYCWRPSDFNEIIQILTRGRSACESP